MCWLGSKIAGAVVTGSVWGGWGGGRREFAVSDTEMFGSGFFMQREVVLGSFGGWGEVERVWGGGGGVGDCAV